MYLDTKSENTLNGKSSFQFLLTKDRIIPAGLPSDTSRTFEKDCTSSGGLGCAAWVIYKENMDYLRCREQLSWNGKTGCD